MVGSVPSDMHQSTACLALYMLTSLNDAYLPKITKVRVSDFWCVNTFLSLIKSSHTYNSEYSQKVSRGSKRMALLVFNLEQNTPFVYTSTTKEPSCCTNSVDIGPLVNSYWGKQGEWI